MKSYKTKFLSILSAIVGIISFVFPINAEEWRLHPSFDRTPSRIIDSPENTYFLVHQQLYDKGKNGYDFPSLTLFRYDKNASDKGITPLVHDVPLSSADIRMADYSPKGDYLIVVYNDGGIDLIDKDMHLTHIDKLKRYTIPGMAKVTSVSFEPSTGDAWIGTDAGYMHVDVGAFAVEDVKVFDRGIDRICKFGDKLVAISGNAAWQSDVVNPLTFNEFKKISSVNSPSIMLPLAEDEFAFVSGNPGGTNALKLAKFDGTNWSVSNLGSDNFYSIADANTLVNRYEPNFIPNRDGYLIYSTSKAWQLYAPKNGEPTKFVSISLDENPVSLGSWDFSNFWSYRDRGTFVPRHADFTFVSNATSVKATWSDIQSPIRPNAPAAFICTYMDYSPKYGMLVINHGQEWDLTYNSPVTPSLLSGYSSSSWNIYSHAYHAPASVARESDLKNIYLNNKNRFPLADPNGLLVDPLNNDIIICGSMFGGIMFQDISDINKDVIRFGAPNDKFAIFPGFVPIVPSQTWDTLSAFCPPVCDNANVVWSVFTNALEDGGTHPKAQLKFITGKDRKTIYASNYVNLGSIENWQTINLPVERFPLWTSKVLAFRHILNNNLLAICMNNYNGDVIILDHKGTLDDPSDDEYKIFNQILGKTERVSTFTQINDIIEDPVTGNVLISTMNNIIAFDPKTNLINDMMPGDILPLKQEYNREICPEVCHVNKIILDDANRMWIGTNNQGVVGVSGDRKSVIARYNTSNSLLPSDCVYGLGWNPETSSLMISTKLGLAEVFPEVVSSTNELGNPILSITHIRPDYNGYVEIRNISPNQNIIIRDSNGIEVKRLGNENFRNIEWDLKNEKGEKVKAGSYKIYIADKTPLDLMIMSD